MSKLNALTVVALKVAAVGLLPSMIVFNSCAQGVDRIGQLEQEIREIKLRLSKLEAPQVNSNSQQQPLITGEGWKSISNWRQLKNGMNASDVRTILGEPKRVQGGGLALWYYQNGGSVTFMDEKLYQWREPE
jgi:hypothetical protein